MLQAIYKCKLCGETEIEDVKPEEIVKGSYPLKTLFKHHQCKDYNIGILELVGYKQVGD